MRQTPEQFFGRIKDKKVYFVGIGVTNTDTIKMFLSRGIDVTACDKRSRDELGAVCNSLEKQGARLLLGEYYPTDFAGADILFRTPGMYFHQLQLEEFRKKGGILTSEMEVFFDLCPCPTFAVTGSDGKTTTTTLISEMLKAAEHTTHIGGNIGKALLPIVGDIQPSDVVAVELSSFQLISMRPSPDISVITNITPNHLDVHSGMDEYVAAKGNILTHQNAFSRTVLGADNELSASFAPFVRGELMTFSLKGEVANGAFLDSDGNIRVSRRGQIGSPIMHRSEILLPGIHNIANYLAAICATLDYADPQDIRKVATQFGGVEHRIEFVAEIDGVRWYNDSIATSPTRAIAGLGCFEKKITLLAGGYDKNLSFDPLVPHIIEKVSMLILSGPTASKIEQAVTSAEQYSPGNPKILWADNLEQAVEIAKDNTKSGDIVSLSPACASFDAYPNFEARGRHFKELIRGMQK